MSAQKITNHSLIILAYVSLFIMGFFDNMRGPYFSSVLADLSLNDVDGSFFYIIPSTFAFIGSVISPYWTQRFAIRPALLVTTLLLAVGFFLLPLAYNFWSMVALCAFYGLGLGFVNVAQNVGVHEGASAQKRRQLFGGLHSMYALAAFSSPFLVGWLFEAGVQWHHAFRVAAIACFVVYLVCYLCTRHGSRKHRVAHHEVKSKSKPPKQRELWLMTMPIAFYLVGEMSLATRLVIYLERNMFFTKEKASFWLALFFALFALGRLTCWALDTRRWSQATILIWSSSLACGFYALGLLISPVFLIVCGLALAPFFPIAMDWFSDMYHEHADRLTAVAMGFGSLTTFSMHFSLGQLSERFGLQTALWIGPFGLLITALSLKLSLKMALKKQTAH